MLSQSSDRSTSDSTGAPCVLLVDDEAAVRVAMLRCLARRGWTVCEAHDGEVARALLEPAAGRSFDLIVCDLNMPRLSGAALYRWLLEKRPDMASRVVFSSGDLGSPGSADFLSEAGRPLLPKPFELSELARIADEVYSQAQAA